MTVLLVAAEAREFAGLMMRLQRRERLEWPVHWARQGETARNRFIMVANGAGPDRAAAATRTALERTAPAAIVSYGYCGALAPGLRPGEVFAAASVRTPERTFEATLPVSKHPFTSGVLVSIPRVAQNAADKASLRAGGADVVEMEAAGVAEQAFRAGLPFFAVRSVTDPAEESFTLDFNRALRADGHFDTMFCLRQLFLRPVAVAPEMLRLWKRSRIAAQRLGEFVADCRF